MCGTKKVSKLIVVTTVKKKTCKYLGKSIVIIIKYKKCIL